MQHRKAVVVPVIVSLAAIGGCASTSDAPPPTGKRAGAPARASVSPPRRAAPEPAPRADEKAREIARSLKVGEDAILWSPTRHRFALVEPPGEPKEPTPAVDPQRRPARGKLRVYADTGATIAAYDAPAGDELRFLDDRHLLFVEWRTAPPPARPGKAVKKPRETPKRRVYVVRDVESGVEGTPCAVDRVVWTAHRDHMACVEGTPGAQAVFVDGAAAYPRTGQTTIHGAPAWSDDGVSLAFIELVDKKTQRLVVLVEHDNPNGDNTWPLPPTARNPALQVFWAGPGQIVVGEQLTRPVFATSFVREEPARRRRTD